MKIYGFQKLTLLDYPEHLAALVFTGGCNYRCPWCQNSSLIHPTADTLCHDEEEVLRQLKKRSSMLEGVVISGGEPTLQPDLRDFILRCREMGYKIKLDTNGTRPDVMIPLVESGLVDYVAMDIKASRQQYGAAVGLERNFFKETPCADHNVDHSVDSFLRSIDESVSFLMHRANASNTSFHYEFRTTVVPELHDAQEMEAIAAWIQGAESYYLQAFRDSEQVLEHRFTEPDAAYMEEMLRFVKKNIPHAKLRGI